MELFFKALAVILAGVAAYFLWQGNSDGGFVAAVLGAVAFFLSVRFQVKARNEARAEEEEMRRKGEEEKGREGEEEDYFENEEDESGQLRPAAAGETIELPARDDEKIPTADR